MRPTPPGLRRPRLHRRRFNARRPAQPATAEPAQPTGGAASTKAYAQTSQQVRYGDTIAFRTLIPSPLLEQLTANEYAQIVQAAADSNRLLPANQPRVKRLRAIVAKLAPYSVKWNDRVKSWAWDVNAIRSRDIRLTCLPGGKVLVYGGLLDRVRLNDELGVLLAHGIAHAARTRAQQLQRDVADVAARGRVAAAVRRRRTAAAGTEPRRTPAVAPLRPDRRDRSRRDRRRHRRTRGLRSARGDHGDKLAVATRANKATGFIYTHPYSTARRQDLLNRLPDLMPLYAKAAGKRVDTLPDYAGISAQRRKVVRR